MPIEEYETRIVSAGGHKIACYLAGTGDDVVLCLNGGPGLPSDYMREPHLRLVEQGFRVVAFDQLGTGQSDKPTDKSLWRIERYVDEVEAVRSALGLGKVHLIGHSWGGWLALEYAAHHADKLASLVLEDTCADMPHLVSELNRLRAALGPETEAMMRRHEAEQNWTHPEYQAAITVLNYRHVCRLADWPEPVQRSLAGSNRDIYFTMQGPNEFLYVGNLKDWNRLDALAGLSVPVLILAGQHDEITPACAMRMRQAAPHAELKIFPNSAHMPFYEEPEPFFATLSAFLQRARSNAVAA
mgnify:CR=1 FL=1